MVGCFWPIFFFADHNLTWRDSKASLVVFNSKNRKFSKILEVLPGTGRDHRLFVRNLPCEETGEWRVQMRSEEDGMCPEVRGKGIAHLDSVIRVSDQAATSACSGTSLRRW